MRAAAGAWGLALLAACVVVAPLLTVTYLPFIDLPNHLARHWLAAHIAETPELQQYWSFDDTLLPNSAADLLRESLGWRGDVNLFGRLTTGIYLVNLLVSLMVLHRALWGRWSALPMVGALAGWNGLLWFGFENFCLALPFVLYGIAGWVWLRGRSLLLAALLLALITAATYFMHLLAFGLLVAAVALMEIGRRPISHGAILAIALACLPPVLHFVLVVLPHGAGHGTEFSYGDVVLRVALLVAPFSRLPFWMFEPGEVLLAFAIFCFCVFALPLLHRRGWLRFHRAMLWPVIGFGALSLAVPEEIVGLHVMQLRAPVLLALIAAAALDWQGSPPRARALIGGVAGGLLILQALLNVALLRERDAAMREFIAVSAAIPSGSRVISVSDESSPWISGVRHLQAHLVAERHAFIPNLFNGASGVVVAEEWQHASHPHIGLLPSSLLREARGEFEAGREYRHPEVVSTFWRTWWRDFTHVVAFAREPGENPYPGLLVEEARGSFFTIYRVVPPPS